MLKNYIFQTQNAIFRTLENANLGLAVLMHKTEGVKYPNIIILGTRKNINNAGQMVLQTEIKVETQDFSPVSSSTILEKIEETITFEDLQKNLNFFSIQSCGVLQSSIFATMEGFFHGMILFETIIE